MFQVEEAILQASVKIVMKREGKISSWMSPTPDITFALDVDNNKKVDLKVTWSSRPSLSWFKEVKESSSVLTFGFIAGESLDMTHKKLEASFDKVKT